MPIVTTSLRRRPRKNQAIPIVIVAIAIIAVVAYILLRSPISTPSTPVAENTNAFAVTSSTVSQDVRPKQEVTIDEQPAISQPSAVLADQSSTHNLQLSEQLPAEPSNHQSGNQTNQHHKERPPKHFPRPTEQLLAMMLSTPPTTEMAPLPGLSPDDAKLNADAILALTNDLVIYETDDEELVTLKETVAELKRQLADAVKNGGNVADVLNEFRNWQNEGVKVRNDTIKAINSIEDDQAAAETFKKANEELVKEDIPKITPEEVGFEEEQGE